MAEQSPATTKNETKDEAGKLGRHFFELNYLKYQSK
jgi:hypothetical protein